MTTPEQSSWNPEHEHAIDYVVRYEDELQDRVAEQVRDDNLFEAGMLTFEHAELLMQLKQNPAARQLVSTAIHFALKDAEITADNIELSRIAVELSINDIEFDPSIGVLAAKDNLRTTIEDTGDINGIATERIAHAYFALAESQHGSAQDEIHYSEYKNHSGVIAPLRERYRTRTVGINTETGPVYLSHSSCTLHDPNPLTRVLGLGELDSKMVMSESLVMYTTEQSAELKVRHVHMIPAEHSSRIEKGDVSKMAEMLLDIPDEPSFMPETEIPGMSIVAARLRLAHSLKIGSFSIDDDLEKLVNTYINCAPKRLVKKFNQKGPMLTNYSMSTEGRKVCIEDSDHQHTILSLDKMTEDGAVSRKGSRSERQVYIENRHGHIRYTLFRQHIDDAKPLAKILLNLPVLPNYVMPDKLMDIKLTLEQHGIDR